MMRDQLTLGFRVQVLGTGVQGLGYEAYRCWIIKMALADRSCWSDTL